MTKREEKQIDQLITMAYNKMAQGYSISIMDISNVYRDCKKSLVAGSTLEQAMQAAIDTYCTAVAR